HAGRLRQKGNSSTPISGTLIRIPALDRPRTGAAQWLAYDGNGLPLTASQQLGIKLASDGLFKFHSMSFVD
ncbi:hypothetical protein, partial [Haematobacter missouriensis]